MVDLLLIYFIPENTLFFFVEKYLKTEDCDIFCDLEASKTFLSSCCRIFTFALYIRFIFPVELKFIS